jgi:hypothetical protein
VVSTQSTTRYEEMFFFFFFFFLGVRRASRRTDTLASAGAEAAGFERAANYGVFLLASDPTRKRFSTV